MQYQSLMEQGYHQRKAQRERTCVVTQTLEIVKERRRKYEYARTQHLKYAQQVLSSHPTLAISIDRGTILGSEFLSFCDSEDEGKTILRRLIDMRFIKRINGGRTYKRGQYLPSSEFKQLAYHIIDQGILDQIWDIN